MNDPHENALSRAASAYLRSARRQPVDWHEWGPDAFAQAARENKPVLLDIGAVWCHWCHVMDRESYESAATAAIINEHFVAIKVDRDERPDIDTRYQAAVQAISGQGGWPLTAFLTPDGRPYFGGTYFPPEDRYGRPSFQRVLLTMSEAFIDRRDEVEESAGSVMAAIEHSENFVGEPSPLNQELLEKLVGSALKQFDDRNGGFGSQPKFPHAGAIDLLIDFAARSATDGYLQGRERARKIATFTLCKMAEGGVYDQLAGGFHRYSVDERWIVPHFEKMSYDNSELLKNYVHAYQTFADPAFADTARDIIRWMDACLSDRDQGGFYASQDADSPHAPVRRLADSPTGDDGDYFTWTREEASVALSPDEFAVAAAYYNINEIGDMHHNPERNVLHIAGPVETVAQFPGRSTEETRDLLARAKTKLHAARLQRPTPFVDKTLYTGWNAMCISAYICAGRILNDKSALAFALKSLDRAISTAWDAGLGLAHVIAYADAPANAARIPAVLEDYAFLATACLDAFEASGELRYFTQAHTLTDALIARFETPDGGFFDTEADSAAIGALTARRKPLQDAPVPAGNPIAAGLLLRLENLTGDPMYGEKARQTLALFAGIVEHFGLYAATYGLALTRAVQAPVQVCVVGSDDLADELEATALAGFAVNKSVIRFTTDQLGALPPALAETLSHMPPQATSFALLCRGNACLPPMNAPDALAASLKS